MIDCLATFIVIISHISICIYFLHIWCFSYFFICFFLGDCAVSGCAPTAQSASQQGRYLGRLFRDTQLNEEFVEKYPDFKFVNKGSLAYLGDGKGKNKVYFFIFFCGCFQFFSKFSVCFLLELILSSVIPPLFFISAGHVLIVIFHLLISVFYSLFSECLKFYFPFIIL